jgi:DNA-binding transcriptional LysR family regulator
VVAGRHRLATGRVTLRRLATTDHVAVSRRGRPQGALDQVLHDHGVHRRVVAVVPTFTSAAHMILRSDLCGLLPARYARTLVAESGAHLFSIPAPLPEVPMSQAWHVRNDADSAHAWLRTQVHQAVLEG